MLRPQRNSAAQEALWPLHDFGMGVRPQSPPAALSLSQVSQVQQIYVNQAFSKLICMLYANAMQQVTCL